MEFDRIAPSYERTATVQKSAAEVLIQLAALHGTEDILDLGCGPGHLTARLRELTSGRVAGLEPSPGMVEQARRQYGERDIVFSLGTDRDLNEVWNYDLIFCNSAFQWFAEPLPGLALAFRALRPGGRYALQAPARSDYCPAFVAAAEEAGQDPRTAHAYARFRSPWFFLESAEDYRALFAQAGFQVLHAELETVAKPHTLDEACAVFESGAAAGYLDPANYGGELPPGYADAFRAVVRDSLARQAGPDGRLDLAFHRIYLLARRP